MNVCIYAENNSRDKKNKKKKNFVVGKQKTRRSMDLKPREKSNTVSEFSKPQFEIRLVVSSRLFHPHPHPFHPGLLENSTSVFFYRSTSQPV